MAAGMSLSPIRLECFVDELVGRPELWRNFVRHESDARVCEQIWADEDVDAWLICWSKDQDTGFHDHDESAAAIAVIDGHVREDRLRLAAGHRSRVIGPGQNFFVAPTAIHRVLHAGGGPAVTIHAYSPPLSRTGSYRIGADGALERAAQPFEHELRLELVGPWPLELGSYCSSDRPNGLPSESLQIAQRDPGWTTLPPRALTWSSAASRSPTAKYGSENESPGPRPRSCTPITGACSLACHPSPSASVRSSKLAPSNADQKRRARSGSSAGNSTSASRASIADTITPS